MQRMFAVVYRRFGTAHRSHLQRSNNQTTNIRCVTTQKSEDLIYIAAETFYLEPKGPIPRSKQPAICQCPEPDQSSPLLPNTFL